MANKMATRLETRAVATPPNIRLGQPPSDRCRRRPGLLEFYFGVRQNAWRVFYPAPAAGAVRDCCLRAVAWLLADLRAHSARGGHCRYAESARGWHQLSRRRSLQRRDRYRSDQDRIFGGRVRRAVPRVGLEEGGCRARQQAVVGVLA